MSIYVLLSRQISIQLYVRHALWPHTGLDTGSAAALQRNARRADRAGRGSAEGRARVPASVPRTSLELLGGVAAECVRPCHTHR